MAKNTPIDVKVMGNHVRLEFGQILMHSEEYATPANAKRAGKALVKAINTRPMRLGFMFRGKWVWQTVRKVWANGNGRLVVLPVDGGPDQARPPYFDPALESE